MVPVLGDGAEHLLHYRIVVAGSGTGEKIVGQAESGKVVNNDPVVAVGQIVDIHAFLVCLDKEWGAVFIGAGHHEDVVSHHALVAGENVGGDAESGDVADMAGSVGVRPGNSGKNRLSHVSHSRQ